jgi:DNA-binding LytR/AlgR family response regulator
LGKVKGFEVAGECATALACFSLLQHLQPDLLFLDIQMPQLNGLDFLRSLQHRPKVIIVSAYREYALEGFELDVVDYLLKPVALDRLLKALHKYQEHHSNRVQKATQDTETKHVFIRSDRKTVKLVLAEVYYIESMSDYLKIYTCNGLLLTKKKISIIEQKLPPHFLRIHRSFILNIQHLQSYTHESIEVAGKILPISRSLRQEVLEKLSQY